MSEQKRKTALELYDALVAFCADVGWQLREDGVVMIPVTSYCASMGVEVSLLKAAAMGVIKEITYGSDSSSRNGRGDLPRD